MAFVIRLIVVKDPWEIYYNVYQVLFNEWDTFSLWIIDNQLQ
jgi:hypothetical protein